ncbi:hypothetical protein [Pleionea sp. CnH1-48]|uniref:hypothetical protein n=1 Tax=Pleionea sp. CnH1-48 TaxID=2954494 RepID=UPI002097D26E|nr:hypothetical protein [Pleionea sp. CnH1-48]MCO7227577.1 hypothetical protein [Pleionea sp. CnH1-48]
MTGIENTSGGTNALVPSKVTFVLNWKTNGTDVDMYSTDRLSRTIYHGNRVVSPGYLDHDNTSGYGPEVIAYRNVNDSVFTNGQFYLDVHFYSGSVPTYYSIDVILNETDENNKVIRHYEAVQPLPYGRSSESGPNGSGSSRFNDILAVSCTSSQICGIGFVDNSKLTALNVSQKISDQSVSKLNRNSVHSELNQSLKKSGLVNWSCNSKNGAKIWH